jgi:hypothetical protein
VPAAGAARMAAMATSSPVIRTVVRGSRAGSVKAARTMRRLSCRSRHRRRRRVVSQGRLLCWACVFSLAGICLVGAPPASAAVLCHRGSATGSVVGRPTGTVAWRAELLGQCGCAPRRVRPGITAFSSPAHTPARTERARPVPPNGGHRSRSNALDDPAATDRSRKTDANSARNIHPLR